MSITVTWVMARTSLRGGLQETNGKHIAKKKTARLKIRAGTALRGSG
jgi:hypothetical protein